MNLQYNEFVEQTLFENVMKKGLDSWDNYSGPDYTGWLCGPSTGRDSDILSQSNFECALLQLGGESKTVEVREVSHWACGWFKQIMVKKASKAAKELFKIKEALDHYPVLNDSDFSEREQELLCDDFNAYESEFTEAVKEYFKDIKLSKKDLINIASCVHQYSAGYFGNDSAWVDHKNIEIWVKSGMDGLYGCDKLLKKLGKFIKKEYKP